MLIDNFSQNLKIFPKLIIIADPSRRCFFETGATQIHVYSPVTSTVRILLECFLVSYLILILDFPAFWEKKVVFQRKTKDDLLFVRWSQC